MKKWILLLVLFQMAVLARGTPNTLLEWRGERLADWRKNADVGSMRVADGVLKGTVAGGDAQIWTNLKTPFAAAGNRYFAFRMKARRGGTGQLFWTAGGTTEMSEAFQREFHVIGDGKWHDYKFYPGWCGPEEVTAIRFDFPASFAGGTPFEIAALSVGEEGEDVYSMASEAHGAAFTLQAPVGINYYALQWSCAATASGQLNFTTPPDGKTHEYWLDLDRVKVTKGPKRGKKSWDGKIYDFKVVRPLTGETLNVGNLRFLKERPLTPPDPVFTSAMPSEAIPRAGRPFVVEAVVRNYGTRPAEHIRFSFDGLPSGVKPLDADVLSPSDPLPGSNGAETLGNDCGPQLPHERIYRFRLSDLGEGRHVFGLTLTADGIASRRIEIVADVKPSLGLARLDYLDEPKPMNTAPYEIGALLFPGWYYHKWHAVWSHDHARKPVLGWYDETNPETVDWQIKHLVENGISFVSVCWFWNNGKPAYNHWMETFAKARYRRHLKWHLLWDNRFNSLADQEKVARFWCKNYFTDAQYHCIEGKPVVTICNPDGMERCMRGKGGAKALLELSRKIAREHGFPGVYFVAIRGMGRDREDKAFLEQFADLGFDCTTVYGFRGGVPGSAEFFNRQRSFKTIAKMSLPHWRNLRQNGVLPFWPSISTGYDDRPWRGERNLQILGYNVRDFASICRDAKKFSDESGIRTLLLGPLDEWGEGSIGYPNHAHGFGILEAVRETFARKPSGGWPVNYAPEDVGLVCPQRPQEQNGVLAPTAFRPGEHVVFLGDSITHAAKYTSYLQMALAKRYTDNPPVVINCGVNGDHASSVLGADRVKWDVLPNRPDRVFVMLGMNDVCRELWKDVQPESKANADSREHALRFYEEKLRKLVETLQSETGAVVLMTPSPYDQYSAFNDKALRGCNEPGLARCAEIVRRIARERELPLVELHRPMTEILKRGTYERLCGNDRVHPGEVGHSLIAAQILRECGERVDAMEDIARSLREDPCAEAALRYAGAVGDVRRLAEYRKALRTMGGDLCDWKTEDALLDKWVERAQTQGWGDGARTAVSAYRALRGQAAKLAEREKSALSELLKVCGAAAAQSDAERMKSDMMNPGSALCTVEQSGGGTFKVLIYGNSIALHGPKPDIGWTNNWGMAASAPEKDFAHLVAAGLEAKRGGRADLRIRNLAALERNFTTNIATVAQISADAKWSPDYVVIAIGENAPNLTASSAEAYRKFLADIGRKFASLPKKPKIVMRSPVWKSQTKADCTAKAAADVGAVYVDAGGIGPNPENRAIGRFWHEGVANHPGDLGMRRLADLILKGFATEGLSAETGLSISGETTRQK